MTAGTTVHAPDGSPVVLAEIGQTELLVNDHVRVWEVALEPGESQPWHLHHNPYLVVNLEAAPGRMDWLDGSPPRFVNEYVGGVIFRPTSPVHMLTNVGPTRYRNRLVELLDLGDPVPPLPAEPVGHHVVFETDLVRAWEIVLDPGASLAAHRHRHPHVVITLDGSTTRIDTAGALGPVEAEAPGDVRYHEPGGVQTLVNVGPTRYRSRLIELKYLGENR